MKVESQINLKKCRTVLFLMTYLRPIIILLNVFGLVSLIFGELYYFGYSKFYSTPPVIPFFFGIIMIVIWPVVIYLFAKQSFSRNKKMPEAFIYNYDKDGYKMIGPTFSADVKWGSIEKVEELNNCIIIYHLDYISNMIPKDDF